MKRTNATPGRLSAQGNLAGSFDSLEGREIVSRREEFVKHFDLGAGRRQAVMFPEPVHYRTADGTMAEIDNALETAQEGGRSVYRNRANSLRAAFPAQSAAGPLAALTKDGRTLSWSLEGAAGNVTPQISGGTSLLRTELLARAKQVRRRAAQTLEASSAKANAAPAAAGGAEAAAQRPMAKRLSEAMFRPGLDAQALTELAEASEPEALSTERLDRALRTPAERRGSTVERASEIAYPEILPGVTARYRIEGAHVKEDLIAANRAALDGIALRLCEGFDYSVQPDQSVLVNDPHTGETLFTFAPPRVYDSEGLEEIAQVVLEASNGEARMTYALSPAFLAEAVYPVTIDPVVQAAADDAAVQDTYLWDRDGYRDPRPDSPLGRAYLTRSGHGEHGESITLVKFQKLPSQSASDTIINAQVALAPEAYWSQNEYMACYPVKTDWEEDTACWNSMTPANTDHISDEVLSYITSTAYVYCYFDVTNLCRQWYKKDASGNSQNFGVAIRYPKGVDGDDKYVEWRAAKNTSTPPKLYVNYVSHAGLEGWWQYETLSAGRAGTSYVDLFNGNLVHSHPDVAMSGSRMPVSVAHYYNSCLSAANDCYCGMGWRTTANQSLHRETLRDYEGNDVDYCVWTDGDGTEHYFKLSGDQPYKDDEGMELKLTISGGTATIRDKSDTAMAFPDPNSNGTKAYITSVTDACGNQMTYTYAQAHAGRVDKVTDGAGRETLFTYNEQNLLSRIDNPDGRHVTFEYDSTSRLTGVGYSDLSAEKKTVFGYEGDTNLLVSAQNYDGLKVALAFEPEAQYDTAAVDNFAPQARRVVWMEKTGANGAKGAKKRIEFLGMTTKVTAVKDADSDAGKALTYQFNAAGNVTGVFDELGYAQFNKFSATLANAPEQSSKLQRAVINLATNLDFSGDWTAQKGAEADTAQQDAGTRCLGLPGAKIVKTTAAETLYRQTVTVSTPGKYTLSAYVKAEGLTGGGAFVRLKVGSGAWTSLPVTGSTADTAWGAGAEGWERVQATGQVDAAGAVQLELVNASPGGTAWFACPQLESGTIANRVNLLVNGDFGRTQTETNGTRTFPANWEAQNGLTSSALNGIVPAAEADLPACLSGNATRIEALPSHANQSFVQYISASGSAGDVYVFGGWANTLSVAAGGEHFEPSLVVRFLSGGEFKSLDYHKFNTEHAGWQFGCWAISAPVDYDQILIVFAYERNAQTGMFTNLFLHREEFGASFAYDDDKNLISTSNLAGEKSKMEYDGFDNLTSYVRPGAAEEDKYRFTYGDTDGEKKKHLVRTESTPMGVKNHYTYDAYGNRLTAKTQKDGEPALIQSETAWNSEGNYAVSSTDARGHSVVKTVDPDSGLVYNVTDPAGQSVAYSYDSANRVTGVEASVAATDSEPAKVYKNAYTYENDRIRTVSHNTTGSDCDVTYAFDYDDLGRKTTVKVGSQTLSANVYADDRSGLLKEVQYGNGGKVSYEYDEFDRLTGVKHDGEASPRYEYEYGANGRAAIVRDHHLNRTVQTEYDLSERPCRNTVRDAETGELIYRTALEYDEQNRLKAFREETADGAHETTFTYDKDNRTTQIRYGSDEQKVEYTYDGLGRIASRKVTNGASAYETEYAFVAGDAEKYGAGATTPLVKKIVQPGMNFEYEYDSRGNIISEKRNGAETKYAYDALGQLIYVNDPHEGAIWYYKYDQGGNILEKRRYERNADGTQGALEETIPYEYGDGNWKDKLTKYNGQTITYDAIGNPLDDGERRYEWEAGRRLKKVWVRQKPEEGIHDGVDGESETTLKIQFTNGNLLTGETTATTVSAKVLKGETDITSEYAASAFVWTRDTGDAAADATWNAAHNGVKTFTMNAADLTENVKLTCTLTGTSPDYGTVYVDENMNLIHAPAEADAEDTLHLENGILSVETEGNEYQLNDNVLGVVRNRLNGSVTAEAWVYTAAPEKLVEFEYNSAGLRVQKKVTDHGQVIMTNYIYHGSQLASLTCDEETMYFFFDEQGAPVKVGHNGEIYTYVYDLSGDIVGILNRFQELVVEYKYDAWGTMTAIKEFTNDGNALKKWNLFEYKGYDYDRDVEMYYLKNRFYLPKWGRFINTDLEIGNTGVIDAHNIFAYCKNNSIMRIDPDGKSSEIWFAMRHPIIALNIGRYKEKQRCKNITTTAARFALSVGLSNPDPHEGTQVNALRHFLWTGIIKSRYGKNMAIEAVSSHEDIEMLDMGDALIGRTNREIMNRSFSTHTIADNICDILNNHIALEMDFEGMNAKEICGVALRTYYEDGLWTIYGVDPSGGYRIRRERLTIEEYANAVVKLSNLDEFGFESLYA